MYRMPKPTTAQIMIMMWKTLMFIVLCVNGRHSHKKRCCLWGFPEMTAFVWVADISTGYTCDGEHAVNLSWTYTMALMLICL